MSWSSRATPTVPSADNLVLRAIAAFRAACRQSGRAVPASRIGLTKRIPMAAGLAGGSTDAATTLRLLAARHPGVLTRAELGALAARIGADVPFFLDGAGAALVSGVGERGGAAAAAHRAGRRAAGAAGRSASSTPLRLRRLGRAGRAAGRCARRESGPAPGSRRARSMTWRTCCARGSTPATWSDGAAGSGPPMTCGSRPSA